MLIDFDNIDDWFPLLGVALRKCLPNDIAEAMRKADPEFIEDARDFLFECASRNAVIDGATEWLRKNTLVGYHGTRLTEGELAAVHSLGLVPLVAEARRDRLTRALSSHPEWHEARRRLSEVLDRLGPRGKAGKREGQVHLTLSRGGLLAGFDHYVRYGAEFDYHAAHDLLGKEGQELLKLDGKPLLIKFAIPGEIALNAAHPYFSANDLRARGDVPNIVDDFLSAWAFRLKKHNFQPSTQHIDCGMIFYESVPPEWIVGIEPAGP